MSLFSRPRDMTTPVDEPTQPQRMVRAIPADDYHAARQHLRTAGTRCAVARHVERITGDTPEDRLACALELLERQRARIAHIADAILDAGLALERGER